MASQIETNIVAVERVKEYSNVEQEVKRVCVYDVGSRDAPSDVYKQCALRCLVAFYVGSFREVKFAISKFCQHFSSYNSETTIL